MSPSLSSSSLVTLSLAASEWIRFTSGRLSGKNEAFTKVSRPMKEHSTKGNTWLKG